jgi:hypothetical protein
LSIPLLQQVRVGAYIMRQHLSGNKRYPLALMLEPLFRCNLACNGCGKIDYPDPILNQRLSVEECLHAVDECGAPIVSIAGGEPLLHKEMPEIVKGIMKRKKFVYLCTNALLMEKKMDDYQPNPYFVWSVHLDGDKEMHDHSVSQDGVYEKAVAAIKEAKRRGFRVNINCTLFNDAIPERVAKFFDTLGPIGVDGITVSPGYIRARAGSAALPEPRQDEEPVPRNPEARRRRQELVVQPVVAVPRLPGRQPDVQVHAVGQPGAYRVRLAEAVLSGRRRLREDLQGTDGRHQLGQLRRRQLREVRGLHGPLRLRSDRRDGHDRASAEGAARQPEGDQDGRPVRAGHLDREAAPGRVRVLAPRRDQARGNPARRQGQAAEAGEAGNGGLTSGSQRRGPGPHRPHDEGAPDCSGAPSFCMLAAATRRCGTSRWRQRRPVRRGARRATEWRWVLSARRTRAHRARQNVFSPFR